MQSLPKDIQKDIRKVILDFPDSERVFNTLIKYYTDLIVKEPDQKRKQNEQPKGITQVAKSNNTAVTSLEGTNIMLQLPDLSVQSPFRKKLNLVFGAFPGEKRAYLALTKSIESKPELILRDITKDNVNFAAILDVPEKKQLKQLLITYNHNDGDSHKNDPILVQLPYEQLTEQFNPILEGKSLVKYLTTQLSLVNFNILDGCIGGNTFMIQAYKGSKEGYLYFLPDHVIFGFRKPILIFDSVDIESITYSSITRLTFNVSLGVNTNGKTDTFEFSMIDQKEFETIDKYNKMKNFSDKSMADELKAQKQLKNNTENPGNLVEAAKMVPGGKQIIDGVDNEEDDEEDDANYQIGDSDDDHSDNSGDEKDLEDNDDDEADVNRSTDNSNSNTSSPAQSEIITPGTGIGINTGSSNFNEDLQQELLDLQRDLNFDIDELQSAGYMNI